MCVLFRRYLIAAGLEGNREVIPERGRYIYIYRCHILSHLFIMTHLTTN